MQKEICLFFGNEYHGNEKLSFEDIVEKYGIRVWNGDKVFLSMTKETETHFHGYADGVGDKGEILVQIEKRMLFQ